MKLIAAIFLCLFSSGLSAIVVPDDAEILSGAGVISPISGTFLVKNGADITFSGVNVVVYVESGASVTLSIVGGTVYLETGATLKGNSSLNTKINFNQTFEDSSTPSASDWISGWTWTGLYPWVWSDSEKAWLFFVVSDGRLLVNQTATDEWAEL